VNRLGIFSKSTVPIRKWKSTSKQISLYAGGI
jgi:hypothetical protein